MPDYEFVDESGERIEIAYPMGQAPQLGKYVKIPGHGRCRRIVGHYQIGAQRDGEVVSVQVHRKHPAIEKRDAKGRAAFSGRKDMAKFCKRTQALHAEDPRVPVYEMDALGPTSQLDRDASDVASMQRTKLAREAKELARETRRRLREG